jgi:hypothetical protein
MNCPDIVVYTACANDVLRDAVWNRDFRKRSKFAAVIEHDPLPIDDIDAIVAGFPWSGRLIEMNPAVR